MSNPRQLVAPIAALCEVLGVYVAGSLVSSALARIPGVELTNPLARLVPGTPPSELIPMAGQLAKALLIQYLGYFLLIIPIGYWHRRRAPRGYGWTLGGRSLGVLAGIGIIAFCAGALPLKIINHVESFVDLGETVPWRAALFEMSLRHWELWVFLAVLGFGLVTVLEEMLFRGYIQARLAEDMGHPTAIVATTALFVLSHNQYFILNPYNVSMLVALATSALAFGIVYARTGSLIPSIVAHALINTPPLRGLIGWIVTATMIVVCILAWKPIRNAAAELWQGVRKTRRTLLIMATALFGLAAIVFNGVGSRAYVGVGLLIAAIGLELVDKRRRKAVPQPVA